MGQRFLTPEAFRRIALSLPEATQHDHNGHFDFRVRGCMFATMGWPDDEWGLVKLPPGEQAKFVAAHAAVFEPVPGSWGRKGNTQVRLAAAEEEEVTHALTAAWTAAAAEAYANPPKPFE